jgi:7-cyano-7-deazaguanine synthase
MKAVVLCSGGLDSVTLAHKLAAEAGIACLVTFDYGQRHRKELEFAGRCAARLGCQHRVIDLAAVGGQLTGSALTTGRDVPDGHYAEDSMRLTIVPNRNAILLSIAYGVAVAGGADAVAAAFHGGDHFIYPDCRPAFTESLARMQRAALDGVAAIALYTPFLALDKAGIVREGARLAVPFGETWSCYRGEAMHCGRCGTCVERREAFHVAGVADPTAYADPDYWRQAIADFAAKTRPAARAGE